MSTVSALTVLRAKIGHAVELMPSQALLERDPNRFALVDLSGELAFTSTQFVVSDSTEGIPKEIAPGSRLRAAVDKTKAQELRATFIEGLRSLPKSLRGRIFPRAIGRWLRLGVSQGDLWNATQVPSLQLMTLGQYLGVWEVKTPGMADMLVSQDFGRRPEWSVVGTKTGRALVLQAA